MRKESNVSLLAGRPPWPSITAPDAYSERNADLEQGTVFPAHSRDRGATGKQPSLTAHGWLSVFLEEL